jgi:hypothetical protein
VRNKNPNPNGNFSSSPNRKAKINHKVKNQAPTVTNYISPSVIRPYEEVSSSKKFYAKQVLDDNLKYMNKDAYMRYNQDVMNENDPEAIRALLEYQSFDPEREIPTHKRTKLHQEDQFNDRINNSPVRKENIRVGKTSQWWKSKGNSKSRAFKDEWFDMD